MGFFDRISGKKTSEPAPSAAAEPTPVTAGGVMPQLVQARERLELKDLPGALAVYEQVLAVAGDRADVLVTISADLGVNGHLAEIVELVAPRYDAERHGPATGLNLLQAYLALRQADAAQHVLDILFALQRPELEERLHGFSNAIAELINSDLPPVDPAAAAAEAETPKVNFVSISKPIWFYGLEPMATTILPPKEGKLRRVAFTQLALLGEAELGEMMKQPETEPGRLTRALPLWLAETFYFSPHYLPIAVVGVLNQKHYALLGAEWTTENLRQLAETTDGGLDYIFTGALRQNAGDFEVIIRLWEVKKFKERKTFLARWNSTTSDRELTLLHEQIRGFMEWSAEKLGLPYQAPPHPAGWLDVLGTSLTHFLGDKGLLPKDHVQLTSTLLDTAAAQAVDTDAGSLAFLTLTQTAMKQGVIDAVPGVQLRTNPIVMQARSLVG